MVEVCRAIHVPVLVFGVVVVVLVVATIVVFFLVLVLSLVMVVPIISLVNPSTVVLCILFTFIIATPLTLARRIATSRFTSFLASIHLQSTEKIP